MSIIVLKPSCHIKELFKMDQDSFIKDFIREKMILQIRADLTIGREDNDLKAFTDEEINEYITKEEESLSRAVLEMYNTYKDDGELNDIPTAPDDWFREFLYIHIELDNLLNN